MCKVASVMRNHFQTFWDFGNIILLLGFMNELFYYPVSTKSRTYLDKPAACLSMLFKLQFCLSMCDLLVDNRH